MKFGMGWMALLAPLVLLAFASPAPAQTETGSASGRWLQVDEGHTRLNAILFDARGAPVYSVDARLTGRAQGTIVGVMKSLPRTPRGAYELSGTYTTGTYGRMSVHASIFVQGPHDMIAVGVLDGVLDVNPSMHVAGPWIPKFPRVLGPTVFQPRPRADRGHFHGRWRMF